MNFHGAAKYLAQAADVYFGTPDDGKKLFTWWPQVPGIPSSPKNVLSGAVNGPVREMVKAARGFTEREAGREIFNVYRESINGRPFLPAGFRPLHGDVFLAAYCIPGSDGKPLDDNGNAITQPPPGAKKYSVVSVETHIVAAHWLVEANPA